MAGNDTGKGPTVAYVNDVVLKGLRGRGISMTADGRIANDFGLSASEFVTLFTNDGWSWPRAWFRRNLNPAHDRDARHLEKEIEKDKWIHVVISPGLRTNEDLTSAREAAREHMVSEWNLPPRHVELHAEIKWSRPSSLRHLLQFLWARLCRSRSQQKLVGH